MATTSLGLVAQLYGISTRLYEKAVDGLDRDLLLKRPDERTNPLLWIAGHLASTRYGAMGLLGRPREVPFGRVFFRGSSVADPSALPPIAEVLAAWREVSPALQSRLEEVTDVELSAPSPREFPIADRTVGGAVTFLAYHEAYHVGQMSYVRKWLGFPGLVDG